jgi:glycosyltransferase involved in cell wall biosynthesis
MFGAARPRVVVVAQGPPARGGIPSFVTGLLDDSGLTARFDLQLLNTTRVAERHAGVLSLANLRNVVADAIRTYRAGRRAEIVHVQTALLPTLPLLRALAICAAARVAGAAVICHVHSGRLNSGQREAFQPGQAYRLLLRGLRVTDSVLTVAEPGTEALRSLVPGLAVQTVDNAVDISSFSPAPLRHEPPVLLYVGTLSRRKGLADLVEALRVLADRGCVLPVRVVGGSHEVDAREAAELRGLVRDSRLPIKLLGSLDIDRVHRELAAADIFCLPSHWEGQPIAILEAMATGLPVIVTAVGANPDVVRDGIEGIVVPPHSPEALAEAIGRLVKDPRLRRQMAGAARARVAHRFDRPHLRDRIAAEYIAVLAERNRRGQRPPRRPLNNVVRSGSGSSAPGWQGGGRGRYWRFVTTSPTTPPAGMRGVASRTDVVQRPPRGRSPR